MVKIFVQKIVRPLNDEHGECFHYEGPAMERTYQGKCSSPILVEYCLRITGGSPVLVYKRQVKRGSINEVYPASMHCVMDIVCESRVT